jgi:cytochrome d ubiquinol oxidase subunit I
MKLAAMEGLYHGQKQAGLVAVGILNPEKTSYQDDADAFLMRVQIPYALSFLAKRDVDGFVPGINDLIKGGYETEQGIALSAEEKMNRGRIAIQALSEYRKAAKEKDEAAMKQHRDTLEAKRSGRPGPECIHRLLCISHHGNSGRIFYSFIPDCHYLLI